MPRASQSDSDEEQVLRPSDDEVIRDEEDAEALIRTPRSGLSSLSPWERRDPNAPRIVDLSPRDQRKQRRKERKMRRRRRGGAEESSLMYEMQTPGNTSDNSGSEESASEDEYLRKPDPKKARRRTILKIVLVPLALIALFVLFLFGTYKLSEGSPSLSQGPNKVRTNGTHKFGPTTILVSLDGFRADFVHRNLTPTLKSFIAEGVSPKYMLPSFPSVTFPNHWTLVTGLHPESHGVVGNSFWDPELEKEFYYTDPARSMQPHWWNSTGAEPVWSTCEKAGVPAAVHMWPGSEAGLEPDASTVDKYNGQEALSNKVARVLGFLDRPSALDQPGLAPADLRPQFIAMYVPDVDHIGHRFGPNSTEERQTISNVDGMLASLLDGLRARHLADIVNVVVVSDHGMATTAVDRLVQLDDLLDPALLAHTDGWPLYGLRPRANVSLLDMYTHLLGRSSWPDAHFHVYLREGMPERYHFKHNERIAPLWIIPDAGWAIVPKSDFDVAAAKAEGTVYHPIGLHGYDHEHPLMRAIFVARGPAFPHVPGSKLDVFQNIEVYNIVCDSLGIEPKPNNGTLRLPLKPVGVHGDDEDSDGVPAPPESEEASKDADNDDDSSDDDDDKKEEKEKTGLAKVWGFIVDKVGAAKDWVTGLFDGGSKVE